MAKYKVQVTVSKTYDNIIVEVDGYDEEKARQLALEKVKSGEEFDYVEDYEFDSEETIW